MLPFERAQKVEDLSLSVQLRHSHDLPLKTKRSKMDKENEDLGSILDGGIFQLQNFLGLITVV